MKLGIRIFVMCVVFVLSSCGLEVTSYTEPSEVLNDFNRDVLEALKKYEDAGVVRFKEVSILSVDTINNRVEFYNDNDLFFSDGLWCYMTEDVDSNIINRKVNISGVFKNFDDKSFADKVYFEECVINKLYEIDNVYHMDEFINLKQSEQYEMKNELVMLTGVLVKSGWDIYLVDSSLEYRIELSGSFPSAIYEDDTVQITGLFRDNSFSNVDYEVVVSSIQEVS